MNKAITAALEAAKANPNNPDAVKALQELAVPKFKEMYARVQKAVRTINRHIGVNKGTPNRATMATAIGLADEFVDFREVAIALSMNEMEAAINTALDTLATIAKQRKIRKYERIDELEDFYTDAEFAEKKVIDAKYLLGNINRAVRSAIDTINRHIVDGTFDVNTYKLAKVFGYKDELTAYLSTLLTEQADIEAYDKVVAAITEIETSRTHEYRMAVPALEAYEPFAVGEEENEGDTDTAD